MADDVETTEVFDVAVEDVADLEIAEDEVEVDPAWEEGVIPVAPVDTVIPIIRSGDWARISGSATKVPAHARGRDVSVVHAPIHRTGADTISTINYEYQTGDERFSVRLIDTGEEFSCGRAAFAAFGPDRGALHGLTV